MKRTKKIITGFLLVLSICLTGVNTTSAQWIWLHPTPKGSGLLGVDFVNVNTGYAVGTAATIMKTTNGGTNWTILKGGVLDALQSSVDLYSVSFLNSNTGYVTGEGGTILKTTNGGLNWILQANPMQFLLNTISFVNVNTGFAAGMYGQFLKTTNGGGIWTSSVIGSSSNTYYGISFTDANTGTIVGCDANTSNAKIYRTTDGGTTWSPQTSSALNTICSVSFINANTGIAGGYGGKIIHTTDGGATWTAQTSGVSAGILSVALLDANTGIASGYNGVIRTTNGGLNWISTGVSDKIYCVNFADANHITAVGNSIIFHSTDSGNNWISQANVLTISSLCGISFINANTGMVAGHEIMKTTNGGDNWSVVYSTTGSPYLDALYDISFPDANHATAVGAGEKVISTTNGGTNWSVQTLGTTTFLHSVSFANSNTGMTVGGSGTIYYTSNGGVNWVAQTSGVTNTLKCVRMSGPNKAIIVGGTEGDEVMLRTENGGANWQQVACGATYALNSVYFLDSNNVFAAGFEGTFLKSTDGGVNWSISYFYYGGYWDLLAVSFKDINNGTLLGVSGLIAKTTNGGKNWAVELSGTRGHLYGICYPDAYHRMAVGAGGAILGYTDSLLPSIPVQISPANGQTLLASSSQLFDWSPVSNATSYRLLIYNDSLCTSIKTDTIVSVDSVRISIPQTVQSYWWKVAGINTYGQGNCSPLWKFSIGFTHVQQSGNTTPAKFNLYNNYPNPFNPTTKIKFDVAKTSIVKITIYDIAGKEIKSLVNNNFMPGTYEITFDASMLSSGVYFCKMNTDVYSGIKKLVLLK